MLCSSGQHVRVLAVLLLSFSPRLIESALADVKVCLAEHRLLSLLVLFTGSIVAKLIFIPLRVLERYVAKRKDNHNSD